MITGGNMDDNQKYKIKSMTIDYDGEDITIENVEMTTRNYCRSMRDREEGYGTIFTVAGTTPAPEFNEIQLDIYDTK